MKSINEFIENIKNDNKRYEKYSDELNFEIDHNIKFPETYETYNNLKQKTLYEYVKEALTKSYSTYVLCDKISKHYNIPIDKFAINGYDNESTILLIVNINNEFTYILEDNWFIDLIKKFGYYITETTKSFIVLEPIYTRNITDIIYKNCKGIIYVLVSNTRLESIIKKGGLETDNDITYYYIKNKIKDLRIDKSTKNKYKKELQELKTQSIRLNNAGYRKYSSRIFFFSSPTKNGTIEAFNEICRQLNVINKEDYSVIKIDLKKSKYNVNCYEDQYSEKINNNFYLLYINAHFIKKLFDDIIPANEFVKKI